MITFELGSEIRFKATIVDYNREKFAPDSQIVGLYCDTTAVSTGTPTQLATGEYFYSYQSTTSDPAGIWYIEWKIIKTGTTTIARQKFLVVNSGSG